MKRLTAFLIICLFLSSCGNSSESEPYITPNDLHSTEYFPVVSFTPSPQPTIIPSCVPSAQTILENDTYQDNDALIFADLSDFKFDLGSGAGSWGTSVNILPDGTFTGSFGDSDSGSGPGYHGVHYYCVFNGKFSVPVKTGDYEYTVKCESVTFEGTEDDGIIKEGIKQIITAPRGFEDADEFKIYLQGKKKDEIPEDFFNWLTVSYVNEINGIEFFDGCGLYNVNSGHGFIAHERPK